MSLMLLIVLLVSSTLVGVLIGGLISWRLRRHAELVKQAAAADIPPEHWLCTDVEQAAEAWANAQGRPEAAGLAADKMHLLHHLARRRGWWR